MNPLVMTILLVVSLAGFAWSMHGRLRLLMNGSSEFRFDRLGERARLTLRQGFGQRGLGRYPMAGLAHKAIFFGFLVLSLRTLILFARGFINDPAFGFWLFDSGTVLGNAYALLKDIYVVLIALGVLWFLYRRVVVRPSRLTLNADGLLILVIIGMILISDIMYDGADHLLAAPDSVVPAFSVWSPLGSWLAIAIHPLPGGAITTIGRLGFWTHIALVLLFLNLLPYSKHFHIITAIPNIFFQSLEPSGRLHPTDDIEGKVEREETLGVRRIDDLSWKGMLDLFSCTECGRCTDHCPAARTGKLLSPKQLTIDLRDAAYKRQSSIGAQCTDAESAEPGLLDLVPTIINPEILWACTTCGACERECPVQISYIDKITDMRRYLVQEKGECPTPLTDMFRSMETTDNPYGVSAGDRMKWADGLDVPVRSATDETEVLFWVGCAASLDDRAKHISRAIAQLLTRAGVKWSTLGTEERCTGDAARRAGNEYLFQNMAKANIDTLNRYNTTKIVTACPHCFNTLKHEYPDFGGHYEVLSHTEFLHGLVREGRLKPELNVHAKVVYHDSCYLGRHNGVYEAPRSLLTSIPGVELVESASSRDRAMCCGAGGAQMFKEEEPGVERVSVARSKQLLETGAEVVSSACPFCMRMLTDALHEEDHPGVEQLDVAELLLRSVEANPA